MAGLLKMICILELARLRILLISSHLSCIPCSDRCGHPLLSPLWLHDLGEGGGVGGVPSCKAQGVANWWCQYLGLCSMTWGSESVLMSFRFSNLQGGGNVAFKFHHDRQ